METPLHEEKDLSKSALQVLLWTEACDTRNTNDMQISVQDRFPKGKKKVITCEYAGPWGSQLSTIQNFCKMVFKH